MKKKTSSITRECLVLVILGIIYYVSVCEDIFIEEKETSVEQAAVKEEQRKPKKFLVIVDAPARLLRCGLKEAWPTEKIQVSTKLTIMDCYTWESPTTNHKLTYYQVKYKGLTGWISEYTCGAVE